MFKYFEDATVLELSDELQIYVFCLVFDPKWRFDPILDKMEYKPFMNCPKSHARWQMGSSPFHYLLYMSSLGECWLYSLPEILTDMHGINNFKSVRINSELL